MPGNLKKVALLYPILLLCPLRAPSQAVHPDSSTVTVVFFTPGGHWRGMGAKLNPLATKAATASTGVLFDGDKLLASFPHTRYLVLRLPAGKHTFSASRTVNHANSKEAVAFDLVAGSATYLAITTTVPSLAAGIDALEKSHISSVPCTEFLKDSSKPLNMEDVADAYRGSVDDTFDVTRCNP